MVPIFSLRSVLGIFLGLIIGVAAGFGYSAFSTTNAEITSGWPPVSVVDDSNSSFYESSIQGRILPATNDDTFIRNMDVEEQYYAARMGSLPFFQYFSDVISKQHPQYAHTAEELSQRIKVSFVTLADNPSVIEIKAGFSSSEETLFILQNIPAVFQDYLLNEQNQAQADTYKIKLQQIDATRQALQQAGQDLVKATINNNTTQTPSAVTLSQDYIALSSRITALQAELDKQCQDAASLLAQGVTPVPTLPRSGTVVSAGAGDTSQAVLDARIKSLEDALAQKAWVAAGFTLSLGSSSSNLPDIAVLNQRYQETLAQKYALAISAIEKASTELSKAKTDMNVLQAKANQDQLSQANGNAQNQLAYTLAKAQVDSLTVQLDQQTQELQAMSQTIPSSQIMKYYGVTSALAPTPLEPAKSAPIAGAVLGMFCGWLVVNRKWLMGGGSNTVALAAKDNKRTM